jgi:Zn-dependent peptidase ImmA (M78 family)/DNA-binding XRE family transcriptional regulator
MGVKIPALVQPPLLVWAREDAGYSLEQAALRIKLSENKLHSWETGEVQPTLRQAEKLAKLYHRPFSIFCLSEPPKTTPLAADYRRLPYVNPGNESPELRVALREMIRRRQIAANLVSELGDDPEPFHLQAHLSESPEAVAARLRKALGLEIETQFSWNNEFQAWREWRAAIEKLGVLVFQFSKVDLEEVRSVSILNLPLPAIAINNREIPASKPFSVLHELVHVTLANSTEEKPALEEKRPDKDWQKVELFAEQVAGAILMPPETLDAQPEIHIHQHGNSWAISVIGKLARRFKVTPSAMATRLLVTGKMPPASFNKWKEDWQDFLGTHPKKASFGMATPAEKALNRNGRSFTLLVLEAFSLDRITSMDAANYLELRYPHIESLKQDLYLGGKL